MRPIPASEWHPGRLGLFTGIPHKDYLAAPGTSISTLRHIRPTPAHLTHYLTHKDEEQPSESLIMGTLIHNAILTPGEPPPQVAVKPEDMTFRSNEGKAWKAEQEAAGKVILGADKWETVQRCIDGAKKCQLLCDIVTESMCEVSMWTQCLVPVVATDDKGPIHQKLLLKCRFDILPKDDKIVLDLKTTDDASEEEWQRSIERHRYHRQAAWYIDVLGERRAWFFALIEKPTGFVRITQLHPAAIEAGRQENERDLAKLAWCQATGAFPGYSIDGTDVCNLSLGFYRRQQS